MHIPVNRWTVSAAVALVAIFGQDFIQPILETLGLLLRNNIPAI
jgi:hypothetical protein